MMDIWPMPEKPDIRVMYIQELIPESTVERFDKGGIRWRSYSQVTEDMIAYAKPNLWFVKKSLSFPCWQDSYRGRLTY